MTGLRLISAYFLLAVATNAQAVINGPSESTGTFTLHWSSLPVGVVSASMLIDQTTGQTYYGPSTNPNSGSQTFTLPNGTYYFREEQCMSFSLGGSYVCMTMDTHTVVVSDGASPPPGATHIVTQGQFNSDGFEDIAVIAPAPGLRKVDDFILAGDGSGNYTTLTHPTSGQLNAARAGATTAAAVTVGDLSMDLAKDVVITNLNGVDDLIIWSTDTQPNNHPVSTLRVTPEVTNFIDDMASGLADTNFFDNAVTTETVTVAGWFVVNVIIISPGYAYDEHGNWRYFDIGFARILLYLVFNETFEVLDPNISPEAYMLDQELDNLGSANPADVGEAGEKIIAILRGILNSEFLLPEIRPPWGDPEDGRIVVNAIYFTPILCRLFNLNCSDGDNQRTERELEDRENCVLGAGITIGAYKQPKVNAPPGNDFSITSSQRTFSSGISHAERRSFWVSRLNDSRDPLAPLAIDVVDDAFFLGCAANSRYLRFAEGTSAPTDLTVVGFDVVEGHRNATDDEISRIGPFVVGKLGPRQVADYHYSVFRRYGLPKRTFGGTPITGSRNEALGTKWVWCPSCDEDN